MRPGMDKPLNVRSSLPFCRDYFCAWCLQSWASEAELSCCGAAGFWSCDCDMGTAACGRSRTRLILQGEFGFARACLPAIRALFGRFAGACLCVPGWGLVLCWSLRRM